MYTKWTLQELDILRESCEITALEKLTKLLPQRTYDSIKWKIKHLGLKTNFSINQESCCLNKLLEENVISYYYIGFFFADGNISSNKTFRIEISIEDQSYLICFAKWIGLKESDIKYDYKRKLCRIAINNKKAILQICNKFDINTNKTINPPKKLPEQDFLLPFIIGLIDGDGNISKPKNKKTANSIRITMHRNWLPILSYVEKFIYEYFNISPNKILSRINKKGYSFFTICQRELINSIKCEIKKIGLEDFVMKRKWDKIDVLHRCERDIDLETKTAQVEKLLERNITSSKIQEMLSIPKTTFHRIRKTIEFNNTKNFVS